ncbi:MAG TPA: hypothetical protein VF813_03255 [Anaerolineaceae bacterium]
MRDGFFRGTTLLARWRGPLGANSRETAIGSPDNAGVAAQTTGPEWAFP